METTLTYQCEKNEGRDKGCSFRVLEGHLREMVRPTNRYAPSSKHRQFDDLHGFFNRSGEPYVASSQVD